MRVAVLALDLAAPVRGRGDEDWEPPDAPGLDAAEAVALLARAAGHDATVLRLGYAELGRLDALACDVAVNLCDGIGRDGYPGVEVVEALLARGVPCTGADRDFLALALDKAAARARLALRGLRVAPGAVLEGPANLPRLDALRPPLVVKPREGGGSVGLRVGRDIGAARALALEGLEVYGGVIVEELVDGPELSVVLLGHGPSLRALPAVEVAFDPALSPCERVLGFVEKHAPDGRWWLRCPPDPPSATLADVESAARAAYEALGGCGHGRVDLRLGPDGPVVLEVNPNPELVPALTRDGQGIYGTALRAAGLSLGAWLGLLLEDARRRCVSAG